MRSPTTAADTSGDPAPMQPPTSLTLTGVARRWSVDIETARRVLANRGVRPERTHATPRYLMREITGIERAGVLAGMQWPVTTGPLLPTDAAAAALDLHPATTRRYAGKGRVAATRLGPRLLRFHPDLASPSTLTERAP